MSPDGAPARRHFRGVSPEARKAQRRARLLAAGLEAFGTAGFHQVGVRELCAAARLTERYFYESFENREALFLAVYEAAVARIREVIDRAFSQAGAVTGAEAARAALSAALREFQAEPRLARILFIEVFTVGPEVRTAQQLVSEGFARQITERTRAHHPELVDAGRDAQLVANGLYGATVYQIIHWVTNGFREPLEQVLEHCVLFFDAVARDGERLRTARR